MAEDIVGWLRGFVAHNIRISAEDERRILEAATVIEQLRRELAEANARTERVRPCD